MVKDTIQRECLRLLTQKIALIEDDFNIARSLKIYLNSEGLHVTHFETAEDYLASDVAIFDLYLIDINLVGMNGLDLCREIRRENNLTPILFITANENESVAVEALSIGSQDFIMKPFRSAELLARIHLHLRARKPDLLCVAGIVLNHQAQRCFYQEKEIKLTRKEFHLLKVFLENLDQVFSRLQLLDALQTSEDTTDRTIDTAISRLKSKLAKAHVERIVFESVYGEGYRVTIKN